MGSVCCKESNAIDHFDGKENDEEESPYKSPVPVIAPLNRNEDGEEPKNPKIQGGSLRSSSKRIRDSNVNSAATAKSEEDVKTIVIERPRNGHRRHSTMDLGHVNASQNTFSRIVSLPQGSKIEHVAAGWPSWLASVAGEAIKGWFPRSSNSYKKLDKIGQGTYSTVYKARDLENDKIVAMKKVRFVNMDPDSVRFMAREICILRRLDHPNVMKLEAVVTSRVSGCLYLVFEYMEHDVAGLLASPKVKFSESQIKCLMKQILCGLEHCHARGVLHRDIKGSNLLVDNNGVLKIGDFGLANFFEPAQKQPLTSRVVTLWYRAPELLLGATNYGPAIDLWSVGCIIAESFAGKPIMPGRTEVEQMHKIFKLCGSPTEGYWKKTKLPHATSFKSQSHHKRRVADAFKDFPSSALALVDVLLSIDPEERGNASSALKSTFFTKKPLPCDPSSLPKYPPSKELDAMIREVEAKKRKEDSHKGCVENPKNSSSKQKNNLEPQGQSNKYSAMEDSGTGFPIESWRPKNSISHSNSVIHPISVGYSWSRKMEDDSCHSVSSRIMSSSDRSHAPPSILDTADYNPKAVGSITSNNNSTGYFPKRNRILFSGPLVPPGGNMEDMLKEHERQIQEAVRKARVDKSRTMQDT